MHCYINSFLLNITHYNGVVFVEPPTQCLNSLVFDFLIPLTFLCLEEVTDRYFISTRMLIVVSQMEKIWQYHMSSSKGLAEYEVFLFGDPLCPIVRDCVFLSVAR